MKKEIYRYKGSGKKPWYQRLKDWALVKVGLLDNPGSPAEGEKEIEEASNAWELTLNQTLEQGQREQYVKTKVDSILEPDSLKVRERFYEIKEDLLYGDSGIMTCRDRYLEVTDLVKAREILGLRMLRVHCALLELHSRSLECLRLYEPIRDRETWVVTLNRNTVPRLIREVYNSEYRFNPALAKITRINRDLNTEFWWEVQESVAPHTRCVKAYATSKERAEDLAHILSVGLQLLDRLARDYRAIDFEIQRARGWRDISEVPLKIRLSKDSIVSAAYPVAYRIDYEKDKPYLPLVYANGRTRATQVDPDDPDVMTPYSVLVPRVGYKRHGLNAKKIKEQLEVQSTWLGKLKNW